MARNTSGRAGFTPENLTAGLDLNIDTSEAKENDKENTPTADIEVNERLSLIHI